MSKSVSKTYLLKANLVSKAFTVFKRTGFFSREKKEVQALKDFTIEIESPIILGLVGPNGAGKTTFIKHCLGLVEKTSGEIEVLGYDPYTGEPKSEETIALQKSHQNIFTNISRIFGGGYDRADFLRQVGLVSGQKQNLDPNLSALESLRLSGYLYDMTTEKIEERINSLVDRFNIREKLDVPVRQLSLGQRMKFEIISSVLHSPRFLFMDEPTLGLDFEAQATMREMLSELHKTQNLTILLTSHYLPDITTLCSRVVVIQDGQGVFDGTIPELMNKSGSDGYLKTLIEELSKEERKGE
jgi:ABC-2 type transport system ATP-binding protein